MLSGAASAPASVKGDRLSVSALSTRSFDSLSCRADSESQYGDGVDVFCRMRQCVFGALGDIAAPFQHDGLALCLVSIRHVDVAHVIPEFPRWWHWPGLQQVGWVPSFGTPCESAPPLADGHVSFLL